MATREELYTALRNADAAGDNEGAAKLAAYIQGLPAEGAAPASVQSGFGEPEPLSDRIERGATDVAMEAGRVIGKTGRAIAEGGLSTVSVPIDLLGSLANYGLEKAGISYRIPSATQAVHEGFESYDPHGYLKLNSKSERVADAAIRGATGALVNAGAAAILAPAAGVTPATTGQRVAQVLADRPVMQAASAATGSATSQGVKEAGGGPLAQFLGGVIGAMTPSLIESDAPALVRGVFRGGKEGRERMTENITAFNEAGAEPTVGQATQSRRMQATESLLSRAPGGAGVMAQTAQHQADDLGAGLETQAAALAPKSSAEQAGRQITRGMSGEGGFIDQFKSTQKQLYDKLDEFIPKNTRIDVPATKAALDRLNSDIPGAPSLSEFFKNSKIKGIQSALKADTEGVASVANNPELPIFSNLKNLPEEDQALITSLYQDEKLPYEAVKKLRTLVGDQLTDWNALSDVPRSKWKALYGALSEDLGGAADEAGSSAKQAWLRANNYTSAGMKRLDVVQSVLDRNGGPESVFKAAVSGTKEGASTLRAVMQSLPEEGQKTVTATVLRRLGLAKAGVQNEMGDKFSTETFLTNWNLLSPEAKRTLFDRFGPGFRSNMDRVAKVAGNLREGSRVFVNPSGTQAALTQQSAAITFIGALLTGHPQVAAAVGSGVAGSNLLARLMANPKFVSWLAQTTRAPTSAVPVLLNRIEMSAQWNKDPDLKAAASIYSNALQGRENQVQK